MQSTSWSKCASNKVLRWKAVDERKITLQVDIAYFEIICTGRVSIWPSYDVGLDGADIMKQSFFDGLNRVEIPVQIAIGEYSTLVITRGKYQSTWVVLARPEQKDVGQRQL